MYARCPTSGGQDQGPLKGGSFHKSLALVFCSFRDSFCTSEMRERVCILFLREGKDGTILIGVERRFSVKSLDCDCEWTGRTLEVRVEPCHYRDASYFVPLTETREQDRYSQRAVSSNKTWVCISIAQWSTSIKEEADGLTTVQTSPSCSHLSKAPATTHKHFHCLSKPALPSP